MLQKSAVLRYRADLDKLVSLANVDLAVAWRQVGTAAGGREMLLNVLPELTAVYGSAAGSLAADWYEDVRAAAGVPSRFRAIVAELPESGRLEALARWSVGPLFTEQPDFDLVLSKAQGGMQRVIADVGRETVMTSSIDDPDARGWRRETAGGCDFCSVLASRGFVYSSSSVDFLSHDHCRCSAVPAF